MRLVFKWLALISLASCSHQETIPGLRPVRIAVGGQAQFIYLPLTLGDQLGYFKDEGLSVTIADLRGGSEALAALMGGSAELVSGFYEHTIRAQAQGKHLVMVLLFDRYPGLVLMVGKRHAHEVHSIGDLVGHPVGVTAPGSSTDQMIKYLLRRHGLDPQSIPVVTAGTTTMIAALEQDRVRAGVIVDPVATKLTVDGTAFPLYDTRTEQGTTEVFGGPWPAGGFYTTAEFIQGNRSTVQALVNAGMRALQYVHSHSSRQIAEHVPEFFRADGIEQYIASLEANRSMFSDDGLMPEDGPANVLKTLTLVDSEVAAGNLDLKKTYDNSFVQAVSRATPR